MPDNKQNPNKQTDQIDDQQQNRQINQPNRDDMQQNRQGQQTQQGGKTDKMQEPNKTRDDH